MSEARLWHLVSYDIREPKRWRRAYKLIKGYGHRVQYSVFRVRGTKLQIERLRWEMEKILIADDDLLIICLCQRCAQKIRSRNRPDAWPEEDPPYDIVG